MKKTLCILILVLVTCMIASAETITIKKTYPNTSWIDSKFPIYYIDLNNRSYRINLDGSGDSIISNQCYKLFSPNGIYMVTLDMSLIGKDFLLDEKGYVQNKLFIFDTAKSREKNLTLPLNDLILMNNVQFSPQSDKIAIISKTALLLIDIPDLKTKIIKLSSIPKREIKKVNYNEIFWSEDGNSLFIFLCYEELSAESNKQYYYELYKLDIKNWQIYYVTGRTFKSPQKMNDYFSSKKYLEMRKYVNSIPHHINLDLGLLPSFNRKTSDGRFTMEIHYADYYGPKHNVLVLKDNKTGNEIIVDKESGGYYSGINPISWTPDYKYFIYRKTASLGLLNYWFLNQLTKFYVFDVEKQKRGILLAGTKAWEVFWFDPNFKDKISH